MATETQLEMNTPPGEATGNQAGKPQWAERLGTLKTRTQVRWAEMEPKQRTWAMVAAGILVALVGFFAWYGLRTDWRVLYIGLDADDERQMEQTLAAAQIPFDVAANGGVIRVPAAQLDKARLATAAKGGSRSGRMGFEIFDRQNWVGSEFDEQVNYQRALEGELEHTIGSIADVESARVHLVMTHDSLFREQERPAKASVVLKLRHVNLADGEPEAIRNLVASAVDGLTADRVVLVDAAGHLPLGPKTPEALRLTAEQALEEKLIATLEPVTGAGNVRASVTLEYDPAASEVTQETYDPNQAVPLTMQRTEQTSGTQPVPAGIPGTASNAPNTRSLPVYPQVSTPPQSSKTETGTYGVSKTTRHMVQEPGNKIRRLTAAIVVNDRMTQAARMGKAAVWQQRTPDELHNLTALAQAAVGYDNSRGDVVAVEDLSFDDNRLDAAVSPIDRVLKGAENSPVLIKYGALVLAVLLVVAFGLRPALRRAIVAKAVPVVAEIKELPPAPPAEEMTALDEPEPLLGFNADKTRAQELFDAVSNQLKNDPAVGSRLLQSWIHAD